MSPGRRTIYRTAKYHRIKSSKQTNINNYELMEDKDLIAVTGDYSKLLAEDLEEERGFSTAWELRSK